MKILLLQLDGKLPNLALMRISFHHRSLGDSVTIKRPMNKRSPELDAAVVGQQFLGDDGAYDRVYASAIFARSLPLVDLVRKIYPQSIVGRTGVDEKVSLENIGITTRSLDYSIYPDFNFSMGFTQRGCRLKCPFCVVPRKEGAVVAEGTVWNIYRGEPWPRRLILLDNDFFGQPEWRERIDEIREGNFEICFSQGINARILTEEIAEAISHVRYMNDSFTSKRLYTAWDNRKDENRLFRGLEMLASHGIKPSSIMVYILIGYWPGETLEGWEYRRAKLRAFGAVPYPMPFVRTEETVAFYRWVVGAHDKRIPWLEWKSLRYQSRNWRRPSLSLFQNPA
jgi:hypothetical protein